jgi:hypothetical protein
MNTTVAMFAPGESLQRTSARKAMSKPAPLRARPFDPRAVDRHEALIEIGDRDLDHGLFSGGLQLHP